VILPYYGDVHSDHRTAFDAAVACTKIFRHPYVKRILAMEIPSETEFACGHGVFAPNLYLDISGYLDKKIEIAGIYGAELADHPFPRSAEGIRALAVNRGAAAGCRYAEAFMLIKGVE
jgi:LmbE family N-acetylglucosaminyl deacetylase